MDAAVAPLAPWTTLKLAGASVTEKFGGGGAATVTVSARVAVRLPEEPLTVNWVALSAAELAAVSVSVLGVLAPAGLNDAVTPVGKPAAVSATAPLKPPCGLTVMVAVPGLPEATPTLVAEEIRVKPGAAVTVKPRVAAAKMLPDFAVMVTVAVPMAAETPAASVSFTPELAGPIVAVTPIGNPAAVRVTAPVKPFTAVIVTMLLADIPRGTLRLAGATPSVKPGAPFTVKLSATETDVVPSVPVTVTAAVPVVAAGAAVNVTVLVVAVVAGLNAAVTPLGSPATLSVTLPLNPLLGVTAMVSVALAPCVTLIVEAEAFIEKFAVGVTVKVMPTLETRLPAVPVTVTLAAPTAALPLATKLNVLAVAVPAGLKDAVTPLGRPETVRFTVLLNPLADSMETLAAAVAP
jgi:hypothetical protein